MLTFCTLFDENYIDKGLVLYKSLERVCGDFTLYILCMSERCFDILADLNFKHLHPVSLKEFENEALLKVKAERTVAEYCWTCSSSLTSYIMETYQPEYCSYIDADMCFYDNPQVLIDEMERRNASVSIVGHRFKKSVAEERSRKVGKYCVECNTFKNDENGRYVLDLWTKECLEYCSADGDGIHWADQKYMDNWPDEFPFVIETENYGAGVAPWNIAQYKLVSNDGNKVILKCRNNKYKLLFYHFAGITYLNIDIARIHVFNQWGVSEKLTYLLYDEYLSEIDYYKRMLKAEYGIENIIKQHPGVAKIEKSPWKVRIKHVLLSIKDLSVGKYLNDLPILIHGRKDYRRIIRKAI